MARSRRGSTISGILERVAPLRSIQRTGSRVLGRGFTTFGWKCSDVEAPRPKRRMRILVPVDAVEGNAATFAIFHVSDARRLWSLLSERLPDQKKRSTPPRALLFMGMRQLPSRTTKIRITRQRPASGY